MNPGGIYESPADFDGMDNSFFLIGLINRFNNGFQTVADTLFDEISWKQVFFLNCITLFTEPPTIKDMAELVGCSHQNAKQLLLKLEKMKFVKISRDADDKRKQRIALTNKAISFRKKYSEPSDKAMQELFTGIDTRELETAIKVIAQLDGNLKKI